MNAVQALIGLVGGLGMFLYGMKMCSDGLQKIAAGKLKQLVKVLTKSPLRGIFVGTLITVGLQSSSATCAIVVSLISAKVMTLAQALGVLLGSAIGSSLTTQLIAFKITDFALVLIFSGACLFLFTKRSRRRSLGQILLGFGLIFYGMFVMSSAMAPIKDYPLVAAMIISLENYPFLAFLVALIVTAILQSSAGFLALLMTLAGQGLVGSYAMIPFVLGAHLGGTITGVLSSLGTPGRESKRAAWANFGFKLINGLLFLPLYRPLTTFVLWSSPDLSRQIANAHTIFSLAMALGFLPFTSSVAKLMQQLIPEKAGGLGEAKYLKENLLEVPELAVDQAHRQTVEMGIIVSDMMK
ncbi:MAG TPA: sodium:phosphate symporter, partial [Firmicutes bacterium]|nr:sodium:phosphate symporter [Bacillota bacterium]